MKNLMLLALGTVALASCAPMMAPAYTLTPQSGAPMGVSPVGTVAASKDATTTTTTAKLTGLAANTYYVAHYHKMGTANADPCRSSGALIPSSKLVGQTDASGALTLSGSVPTADIASATYFNVHTATDSMGTPADGGIACTSVTP